MSAESRTRTISSSKPFAAWLLAQTQRADPVGRLARAAEADATFPRTARVPDEVLHHIVLSRAADEETNACYTAAAEWKAGGRR
jgi:hypothetical protein